MDLITGELPKALSAAAGAVAGSYAIGYIPVAIPAQVGLALGALVGIAAYSYSSTSAFMIPTDVPSLAAAGGAVVGPMVMPGIAGVAGGAIVGELAAAYLTQ